MSRLMPEDEIRNQFVDDWVERLLPKLEACSTLEGHKRKAGAKTLNRLGAIDGYKVMAEDLFASAYGRYVESKDKGYRQAKATCKKLLDSIPEGTQKRAMQNTWRSFNAHVNTLYAPFKRAARADYGHRVELRQAEENLIEIDLTEWLEKAHRILTLAEAARLKSTDWQDVSCALALVSGRRMAEIHCTAQFEKAGDYAIKFSGRLKGGANSGRDREYVIPTLIPADLVVAGLTWLDETMKRIPMDSDPLRVNAIYSKALSKSIKEKWMIAPDELWQASEGGNGKASMSYHKLRGCYFAACSANYTGRHGSQFMQAARGWLADDADKSIASYERIKLAEGSKSRI